MCTSSNAAGCRTLSPTGLEFEVLGSLLGTEDAARGLDVCALRGLVRLETGLVVFRHELARRTIGDSIPAGRRLEEHHRVLLALESLPGIDVARLAYHAAESGDADRLLIHGPEAARIASARGAHRAAARYLERALVVADRLEPVERARLLERLAAEQTRFDLSAETTRARERAVHAWRVVGDRLHEAVQTGMLAATADITGSSVTRAHELYQRAEFLIEGIEPSPEVAEIKTRGVVLAAHSKPPHEVIAAGQRAIELAEQVDADGPLSSLLWVVGCARVQVGDVETGLADVERGIMIALDAGKDSRAGFVSPNAYALSALATVSLERGAWVDAEDQARAEATPDRSATLHQGRNRPRHRTTANPPRPGRGEGTPHRRLDRSCRFPRRRTGLAACGRPSRGGLACRRRQSGRGIGHRSRRPRDRRGA